MSIASRITAMTEHIDDIYDTVELTGVDTTGLNKNLVNVPNTLKDGFVDIINNGVDTLYENFPKVVQTGEEPTLNGVYEAPMRVDLNGNTEQTTYTGKNLLNITNSGETINGITYKKNEDGSITLNGTATANTNIRISTQRITQPNTYSFGVTTDISSYANQLECGGYIYNSDGSFKYNLSTRTGRTPRTISNGEYITNFFIYIIAGQVFNNLTLYPQLELGPTTTEFEPYVGGTPSPNPDYPQDIRVVKGNNTIKVTGKNILQITNLNVSSNGIVPTLNSDGSLSYSGTTTATSSVFMAFTSCNWKAGDYKFSRNKSLDYQSRLQVTYEDDTTQSFNINATYTNSNVSFTKNVKSYRLSINGLTTDTEYNDTLYLQLEQGSTVTDFQPYQEQTYPLNLNNIETDEVTMDIELCKIGNYEDIIFKQHGQWHYGKIIKKIVLDGSETPSSVSASTNTTRVSYNHYADGTVNDNIVCNLLTFVRNWSSDIEGIAYDTSNGGFWFRINKSTIGTTQAEVQSWLSSNNLICYIALATPTDYIITDTDLIEQLEDLKTAKSVEGQTNITQVNEEMPFILDVSGLKKD